MRIDVASGGDFLGRIGYDCARIGPDHNLGPNVTPADAACELFSLFDGTCLDPDKAFGLDRRPPRIPSS